MKVFLDTNVMLDAALPARPRYAAANAILSACDYGTISGCVSILTAANMAYMLKRGRTVNEMKTLLKETLEGVSILPMDNDQLQTAYGIVAPDFEDVLQYACARAAGCDLIVTDDTRHYRFSRDIEVVSTMDFARRFVE